jgi:hypothetical protein
VSREYKLACITLCNNNNNNDVDNNNNNNILEVKNWKKVALDRDEWAKLLRKARAHQGLYSQ